MEPDYAFKRTAGRGFDVSRSAAANRVVGCLNKLAQELMVNELAPETTATAELVVASSDLASALPLMETDAFPSVFATTRMVALMEIASARVLQPHLAPGQLVTAAWTAMAMWCGKMS